MRDFPENLYAVLGIAPDASEDEVRRAGRHRQRQTHPDLGGDASEFTRVRLALEVLLDEKRRAEHDAWLAARHGIIAQRRDTVGTRLRQQQRAPRQSPQAPSPHAHSTTAGSGDVPEFERIPKPRVQAWRMGWYRKQWHPVPDVWPPARPLRRAPGALALVSAIVLVLVLGGICVWQLVPGSPIAVAWWPALIVVAVLSAVWFTVHWQGATGRRVRMLMLATVAIAALDAAASFVLAMVGFFEGNSERIPGYATRGVALLVVAGVLGWSWFATNRHAQRNEMERILCEIANEQAPPADDDQRMWGEPGATALRNAAPGVNPIRRRYAELIIGPQLDALTQIPGVRIVHGVRLPGSDPTVATISHAVLAGRRLALIDDQLWRPGNYALDHRGQLLRNDFVYANPAQEFPHRVAQCDEYFADAAQVRGWVAVVADSTERLAIDNARTWPNVRLADAESLLREVGEWLAGDGERVDRLLLRDVLALQVDPS